MSLYIERHSKGYPWKRKGRGGFCGSTLKKKSFTSENSTHRVLKKENDKVDFLVFITIQFEIYTRGLHSLLQVRNLKTFS